ncbi:MAG: DUF6011 domain-containing protein [Jiangellaceae bacterium]
MNPNETAALIAVVRAGFDRLPEGAKAFASDFLHSCEVRSTRGQALSPKQGACLIRLANQASGKAEPAQEVGNVRGVIALFDRAAAGLKRPALVLTVEGIGSVRLYIAGERSRYCGQIMLVAKDRAEGYLGRIDREGRFHAGRGIANPGPEVEALVPFLRRLAASPEQVAAEYGKRTGACCFCSRKLTDERSVGVGYGPICADNWGLPWGEVPTEVAAA